MTLTPSVTVTPDQLVIAAAVALVASIAGGILGGLAIGAKHLGGQLAAMMGAFFGPIAGFWGVLVGLGLLVLLALLGG